MFTYNALYALLNTIGPSQSSILPISNPGACIRSSPTITTAVTHSLSVDYDVHHCGDKSHLGSVDL